MRAEFAGEQSSGSQSLGSTKGMELSTGNQLWSKRNPFLPLGSLLLARKTSKEQSMFNILLVRMPQWRTMAVHPHCSLPCWALARSWNQEPEQSHSYTLGFNPRPDTCPQMQIPFFFNIFST